MPVSFQPAPVAWGRIYVACDYIHHLSRSWQLMTAQYCVQGNMSGTENQSFHTDIGDLVVIHFAQLKRVISNRSNLVAVTMTRMCGPVTPTL
jgi:hypothetical protein